MRSSLLILAVAACGPAETFPEVDHAGFWGTWTTLTPAEDAFAAWTVTLGLTGTRRDGADTAYTWEAVAAHTAESFTPGCTSTLAYAGAWRAACPEALGPDPTDPAFPLGSNAPTGCVRLTVDTRRLTRATCDDPTLDGEVELPEELPAGFDALDYARPADDELWLGWSPELLLSRTE